MASTDFEVLDAADTRRIPVPDNYSFKFPTQALLISEENVDVRNLCFGSDWEPHCA